MRSLLAVAVLALAGCTVTVDVDDTGPPSEFYQDFDLRALTAAIPGGDEYATGASGGGGQGMTTHDDRKYYKRSDSVRLQMPVSEHAHFLNELRLAMESAIDDSDVRVQGRGTSLDADEGLLERFDFEYVSDEAFGWVTVDATSYADQLAITVYVHEAEI